MLGLELKDTSDMAVNGRSSHILSIPIFASQMNIAHRKYVYFATPSSFILPFINASKGRASKPKQGLLSLLQPQMSLSIYQQGRSVKR
jgi:hypothetical protein